VIVSGGQIGSVNCTDNRLHYSMNVNEKTIWVTGASSGIGRALAVNLSRRGARLILSARSAERLEDCRHACTDPERHVVLPLDLTDTASLEKAAQRALQECGSIDILINNGGISQRSVVVETRLEVDRRIMEVNFFGAVTLTKLVLPSMRSRTSGHIVVISSVIGKFGSPFRSSYAASKHALHGFFESLRAELWGEGIRVTMVCPGFVRTNISVNALKGDGSTLGSMDPAQAAGMDPEICAEKMVRAVEAERNEVYIGGKEKLGVYLQRFVPDLFALIIRKTAVR
jgi:dehydrogenase/reductase SDR family member 7B